MTYHQYPPFVVLLQATGLCIARHWRQCDANDKAVELQRANGGTYIVAKVLSYTQTAMTPNKRTS